MKIEPILINAEKLSAYTGIALLVDREDFLEDVLEARRDLGITKLIPYKKVERWEQREFDRVFDEEKLQVGSTKVFIANPIPPSVKITKDLLFKYKRSHVYINVVRRAILCGEVSEKDFGHSSRLEIVYPDLPLGYSNPILAIVMSPETTIKEIADLLKKQKRTLQFYDRLLLGDTHIKFDTKSGISEVRAWYWLWKEGFSYDQIIDRFPGTEIDTLNKALVRYRKALSKPLKTDI